MCDGERTWTARTSSQASALLHINISFAIAQADGGHGAAPRVMAACAVELLSAVPLMCNVCFWGTSWLTCLILTGKRTLTPDWEGARPQPLWVCRACVVPLS